ncbi:MAG: hypothetical protein AAGD05_19145, partial [Bacteroidota bacterium]
VKTEDFVFDVDNSNIDVLLGEGPVAIDYDVDASTNPDGDTELRGFVTDSSFYKVSVDVDLPLYGWATDFSVTDTFSLDLSNLERVDYAEFKLVSENSMPVAIGVQGYFLDEAGQVLDSLFNDAQRIIQGAPVDAEGYSTGIQETVTYADFPKGQYAIIQPAANLVVVATFFTTTDGAQSVRIQDDQSVQIKLGAILGVSGE